MCCTVHPDTIEGGHDINIPWEILGLDDALLCYLSVDKGKSGQFGHFWAPFFGPEGGPYGHECEVWSTQIPTRKVDMM